MWKMSLPYLSTDEWNFFANKSNNCNLLLGWQTPGLNVITEYIIGYLYPGYPVANMCFKVYGYISMKQGILFLQDFKLGHYMKIPPRSMFMAQVSFLLWSFSRTETIKINPCFGFGLEFNHCTYINTHTEKV